MRQLRFHNSGPRFFMVLALALAGSVRAELQPLADDRLQAVSGQAGLSVELPHVRLNARGPGSVDDPDTTVDESDGAQNQGFTLDYVTRTHSGSNETHLFADAVSLALDVFGPFTLDIESSGELVLGLPERMHFVGDGFTVRGIHLNTTGLPADGGRLMNEVNIRGNFSTGGTVHLWSD